MSSQSFSQMEAAVALTVATDAVAVKAAQAKLEQSRTLQKALNGLQNDWFAWQKKSRSDVWFFFSSLKINDAQRIYDFEIMWADELSGGEASLSQERTFSGSDGYPFTGNPPPHGPMESVVRYTCPHCGQLGLAVGHMHDTRGVLWLSSQRWICRAFVLCESCLQLTEIAAVQRS